MERNDVVGSMSCSRVTSKSDVGLCKSWEGGYDTRFSRARSVRFGKESLQQRKQVEKWSHPII